MSCVLVICILFPAILSGTGILRYQTSQKNVTSTGFTNSIPLQKNYIIIVCLGHLYLAFYNLLQPTRRTWSAAHKEFFLLIAYTFLLGVQFVNLIHPVQPLLDQNCQLSIGSLIFSRLLLQRLLHSGVQLYLLVNTDLPLHTCDGASLLLNLIMDTSGTTSQPSYHTRHTDNLSLFRQVNRSYFVLSFLHIEKNANLLLQVCPLRKGSNSTNCKIFSQIILCQVTIVYVGNSRRSLPT